MNSVCTSDKNSHARPLEAWLMENQEIFGAPQTKENVFITLKREPGIYAEFQKLSGSLQEELLSFCMGTRGLNITYDPVFKMIFNPETHPERLEEFLSLCLKMEVKILRVIPNESGRLTEDGSLLIMDILVCLVTGELVNVEIQRIGYLFPGARCACYSSDLMMRQYSQVKEGKRLEGKHFSYNDVKKVYTIVLIEKSTEEFHRLPDRYLHYGQQSFNTGLNLDMLQNYLLIPLDILKKYRHNISNKLDGWLYFIASDQPADIRCVVEAYPEFRELYREVFRFRYHVKELVSMFSDALRILDANTTQYMIEVQQEEIERLKAENQKQKVENQQQEAKIQFQQGELESLKKLLSSANK